MIEFLKKVCRSGKNIAVALCAMLVFSVLLGSNWFALGYEVYYKGESMGVTSLFSPVLAKASESEDSAYYLKIVSRDEFSDEEKILEQLALANEGGVEACVLYLSGEAVLAVENETVLENVLEEYRQQYGQNEITIFNKETTWETKLVAPENVCSAESAKTILSSTDENGAPLLRVLSAQTGSWEEELPYETVYENTDELTQGHTVVKSEGKNGTVRRSGYVFSADGSEVQKYSLTEEILEESIPAVVLVGTREPGDGEGTGTYVRPCAGTFSSDYGSRWGRNHNGVDLRGEVGTQIVAADSGTVTFAGWNDGGFGYLVKIDHGDGIESWYAHCSELLVEEGDIVGQGELIARVGNTGRSTGSHLHFEIRISGSPVNPSNYINF